MNKTWKLITGITLSTALLFGCSQEGDIKEVSLNKEEQEAFATKFLELSNQEVEPKVLVEELNQNIAGLDLKKASDSVDALLYNMYQHREDMNVVAQGLQESFLKYEKEKVNFNKKEDVEKVEDAVLKAFLEQAHERLLLVKKENNQFVVQANFDKILSQYEEFMAEDLKEMVKFSKEESETPYYDEETQKLKLDVVAERIVFMENLAKKHPDSFYNSWMNQSKDFYYQHYFGMNGMSIADTNQNLLPDVEKHFKSMSEKYKGTEFAKNINLFFEEFKKNGNKVNDNVYVFLLDLTKKEHETINEEKPASTETSETTDEKDQAKNAIQKAIEENKSGKKEDKQ